ATIPFFISTPHFYVDIKGKSTSAKYAYPGLFWHSSIAEESRQLGLVDPPDSALDAVTLGVVTHCMDNGTLAVGPTKIVFHRNNAVRFGVAVDRHLVAMAVM